jgi:Ala-tRNA(Pro) deacylase
MRLQDYLDEKQVEYKRSTHSPSYTSQGLAEVEHVSGYQVAKPVVVKGDLGFAMCVVPACRHVDLDRVGEVLQSVDVRLASEPEMAALFPGCELGAEPPIGALFGLRTIVDAQLHEEDTVVMQAGSHTSAVEVRRADWERLCKPIVAEISC